MKKRGTKKLHSHSFERRRRSEKKTCFAAAFFGREEITGSNWPHVAPSQSFFPWQSTTIKVQFVVFPRSLRELLLLSRKMCCKILQMAIKKARQAAFLVYFMTEKDNLKTSVHILKYVPKIRQRNVSQYRKFDSMSH